MPFDDHDKPQHDPAALAEALLDAGEDAEPEQDTEHTADPGDRPDGAATPADPFARMLTSVLAALAEAKKRPTSEDNGSA